MCRTAKYDVADLVAVVVLVVSVVSYMYLYAIIVYDHIGDADSSVNLQQTMAEMDAVCQS